MTKHLFHFSSQQLQDPHSTTCLPVSVLNIIYSNDQDKEEEKTQ